MQGACDYHIIKMNAIITVMQACSAFKHGYYQKDYILDSFG